MFYRPFSDILAVPCTIFYKKKCHETTKHSAEQLLQIIAAGEVSDVGESDDDDDDALEEEGARAELARDVPIDASDDENVPQKDPAEYDSVAENVKKNISWKKQSFLPPSDLQFTGPTDDLPELDEAYTPYTYFSRYVPESIFACIAKSTNLYSVHTSHVNVNTTPDEMRKLFGMHILMGVVSLPRVRLYWDRLMRVPMISETMSEKRFFKLRNNLHATVDEPSDCQDRLWKVRPLLDQIRARCLELQLEEECSIDEQMIPFKGNLSIKQYVKGKPTPWGIKVFALCGRSGMLYDFVVYQGENTIPNSLKKDYGLCSGVVLHLAKRIPTGCNYQLYFDNYFTSLPLLRQLKRDKILAAGTARTNRLCKCPLAPAQITKKKPRGYSEEFVTQDNIVVMCWKDNNTVTVASNFVGVGTTSQVERWDKKTLEHVSVTQPEVIAKYNKSMGGVDKLDFLLSLYRTKIRSKKWTLRAIFHFVDVAVCNSWIEYLRDHAATPRSKLLDLMHFRLAVAEALITSVPNKRKRGRPSLEEQMTPEAPQQKKPRIHRPCADARYDGVDHWPEARDQVEPSRCKLEKCKGRSRVFCRKCHVPLCLTKDRNCFYAFHN